MASKVLAMNQLAIAGTVINVGGARSTKSFSILQLLLLLCCKYKGLQILIVRKTLPSLRDSTLIPFYDLLLSLNLMSKMREEKQGLNFFINGNRIKFGSVDDPEKWKSTEWNYIFMEEMNEFNLEDYRQLKLRLSAKNPYSELRNQLFGALNPIDEFHWVKELIIDPIIDSKTGVNNAPDEVQVINSIYKYNRTLSADYIQYLESLINQDINHYRIYVKGEWGRLEHLIYTNWAIAESMPAEFEDEFYSLDFGFNNPSALLHHVWDGKEVWEEELIYRSKLTNSDLIKEMDKLGINKNKNIYADSAEPDRIKEIQRAGYLCKASNKTKDTGIDYIKRIKVNVLKTSTNIIKEKRAYSYKVDRNGHVIDEPIDFMNHAMDAERYGIFNHLGLHRNKVVRWI